MSPVSSIRVTKEIEKAILSGYLKPRERLIEMDLIARFGVSRTVIRDALKVLESKGLVRITPYKGGVVNDLTTEEVEEIYFLRTQLERLAARLVVKHITPEEIQTLKSLCREAEAHFRKKADGMIEVDSEFHRALFRACRNQYLYEMIDHLRTKSHIVRFNAWSLAHRIQKSILEHQAMIAAIEDKDKKELERLVIRHLAFSKKNYLTQLKTFG
jgi:DNA-binding GntR family transcriptional regulator